MSEIMMACPHCGDTEIVGNDKVYCTANINSWTRDEAGDLQPNWAGDTDVDWDSQVPRKEAKPYICCGCSAELSGEDLVEPEDDRDDDFHDEDEATRP